MTSDHGETLGENGLLGHGFSLDDRLIPVPLVVRGPIDGLVGPAPILCDVPGWQTDAASLPQHPCVVGDGPEEEEKGAAQLAALRGALDRAEKEARPGTLGSEPSWPADDIAAKDSKTQLLGYL